MFRQALIGCMCAATAVGGLALPLWADTLKLKDGTSLSGRVMDEGSTYWVKADDGQTHTVAKDSVEQWVRGDAAPAAASAASSAGRGPSATVPGGASFQSVKAKCDRVDTPIQAVALWQTFLDNHPSTADAAAAKQQLATWRQMVDGHAERVNGKWIYGPERTKLLKKVRDLLRQAREDMAANQTLKGLGEFQDAVKMYPNDFEANFDLGYFNLYQGAPLRDNKKIDAGVKAMETAVKLRPNSAPALIDLAVAYHFQRKYLPSIETAYRAAQIEDTKDIVQDLVNTITHVPPTMNLRQNSKVKPIVEQAMLLAAKYSISGNPEDNWEWVRPDEGKGLAKGGGSDPKDDDAEDKGPPGIFGNGTGELVSADGYILTNRHVAKAGDYLMVRLSDGTLKVADRVVIDDDQDMAIIKIKADKPMPFVHLAGYEHPPVGEDVAVFGFPLLGLVSSINSSVKMTRGIVTAWDDDRPMCDVTVDANINPGNSGGPMVDHFGNLLAITTAKTTSDKIEGEASISSYGLGQSTGRLRKFFAHQAAKLTGLHLVPGNEDTVLTNEQLATRLTPVTVCVFMCRGERPTPGEKVGIQP